MRVAIAGGGIAGLSAAIALAERGFEIDLYERTPALEEIGAGIQLSPNAMAVLDRLGVTKNLAGHLSEPDALVIRDAASGATLARIQLGKTARKRYGAPYCTLHRADLQAGLVATARAHASIALNLGAEVRDVSATETAVSFTAAGESRQADLLVAADGVRSAVRTGYFHHTGPVSLGHSAWRATLPADILGGRVFMDEVALWLGAGAHLVHYPMSGGAKLNVVVIAAGEASRPPSRVPFAAVPQPLLDALLSSSHSPLVGVDATFPWSKGRVALIGDAAHAMAPSSAQGGAQAIEDAWALAAALSGGASDPAAALAAYARIRRPRVSRVARMSSRNLELYEMDGVPALVRNSLLRILPATLMLARIDWLFRAKPQ